MSAVRTCVHMVQADSVGVQRAKSIAIAVLHLSTCFYKEDEHDYFFLSGLKAFDSVSMTDSSACNKVSWENYSGNSIPTKLNG